MNSTALSTTNMIKRENTQQKDKNVSKKNSENFEYFCQLIKSYNE